MSCCDAPPTTGHPRAKDLPFEIPPNIDRDAFLLLGDPTRASRSLLGRWWNIGGGVVMGVVAGVWGNVAVRRPPYAGLPRIAAWVVGGAAFGELLYRRNERIGGERDLQFFHYICLHPEDFPVKNRILYRDYLETWVPFR